MLTSKPRTPKYRLHKPSGQAVVTLSGRAVYLGRYDSPESREKYHRTIAEWLAGGRTNPEPAARPISVAEVLGAYHDHAQAYYVRDGQPGKEMGHVKNVIKRVRELFGLTAAKDFGPLRLKTVRQRFIELGQCRKNVNANVQRVVRIFRWAVAEQFVSSSVWEALRAMNGLRYGHTEARESDPVRPVPDAHIEAVLPHVLPEIAAMIKVQRLTGMRSGELVSMRTRDIDTTGTTWCYRPVRHKTQYHGHAREVWIGPRAQQVLRAWLRLNIDEYLFSPRRARRAEFSRCPTHRKQPTRKAKMDRRLRDRYDVTTYYQAVTDGCDKAELAARGFVSPFKCPECGATFSKWHL